MQCQRNHDVQWFKPAIRSRRHTGVRRSTLSARATSANAGPILRRRRREPIGRAPSQQRMRKNYRLAFFQKIRICVMLVLSGRAAPNSERREARRSEKGARNKTTANLLIFHETAKSTISQVNDFNDLEARRRSVFVSQAKFFSSQAKFFRES